MYVLPPFRVQMPRCVFPVLLSPVYAAGATPQLAAVKESTHDAKDDAKDEVKDEVKGNNNNALNALNANPGEASMATVTEFTAGWQNW